ncbi:MAG: calcium-translocating P-type ATPase, SERCA-type [Halanaerobiaceae bacterium]|nr:calcium-translocating P-type ATPase, SERCA-type [Halanaerobiaceae bacterium]
MFDTSREFYLLDKNELRNQLYFSEEDGLSSREARKRLTEYGENKIKEGKKRNILTIFIDQFRDFMIVVLLVATGLSFIMGEFTDGLTIFAIVILNGLMGFIQEYRAEKSLDELKKLASPRARVIRDGRIEEIDSRELVPGDLLLLERGDKVPADARILFTRGLQVDEALLTGESVPVTKSAGNLYKRGIGIAEQRNMVFMGTTVTGGKCRAVVVNTGMNTEMGKIAHLLEEESSRLTPLQQRLKNLGKKLVFLCLSITVAIVFLGIIKGQSLYNMFLAGVSLAVAAIPEGLPAIVTLTLAIGVQKMIKNKAIVRKLPAVETLGCSTVICSDKTGTLTENQMALQKVYINNRIKDFGEDKQDIFLEKILQIGALCSSVVVRREEKDGKTKKREKASTGKKIPEMIGDPTEIALVRAYYCKGYSFIELKNTHRVLGEESFDPQRKRMSILVELPGGRQELWIKGAPEIILDRCRFIERNGKRLELSREEKDRIIKANNQMAGEALRVLAIAYRPFGSRIKGEGLARFENNLVFLGLVGLIDPPRKEAYQAVSSCYQAGIRPIMVTGDHKLTARIIAEDLGIIKADEAVLTGEELSKMDFEELKETVKDVQVYARISPEDKLRIVRALRENGEIVAMTGDGVNDAPAVKEADIGIAMGKKGTDVTREVASLILADDNFATIVKAIEEGRKIYNNIRKFIKYLLACNIGELLAIFLGIALGLPLPLIPIQILWVNLVTDGLPALALGFDEDSDDLMKKKPRKPGENILSRGMVGHIISEGVLIGISTILAFLIGIFRLGLDLNTARTMAFSTLVFSQLFFVFSCRSEEHSFWELSPFSNLYLVGAVMISSLMQLAVIYLPFFSSFFRTEVLNLQQWLVVIFLSTWSTIIIDLLRKAIKRLS